MQQLTRKSLGAMLASVGVATLIGVMGGGIVSADVEDQTPPFGFENAPTEAEVTMKERCIWYVHGVASEITLAAQDDPDTADIDESLAVYDGDQYSLSTSTTLQDYLAWTSGNINGGGSDYDEHEACTFFGEQTGISVTGVWSDTAFDAEAQNAGVGGAPVDDTINMGFNADGTDPLTMVITEGVCRASGSWTVGPNIVANVALSGSILDLALAAATERPADDDLGNDKCNAEVSVTASIPAGKTPLFAGKPYKFTGPSFTTEINIDSNRLP